MKRLLKYLKPHKWTMTLATFLVLFIIAVELGRPIIIGDAIDDYINGYFKPYKVTQEGAPGAVKYQTYASENALTQEAGQNQESKNIQGTGRDQEADNARETDNVQEAGQNQESDNAQENGRDQESDNALETGRDQESDNVQEASRDQESGNTQETGRDKNAAAAQSSTIYLTREYPEITETELASGEADYYQLLLYDDRYYMAEGLTASETELLSEADQETIASYLQSHSSRPGSPLTTQELKELRQYDFQGILRTAALYFALLLLGFALNAADTWMLQKMGQKIIYSMREEVFRHIHSLSLSFFNTTPVGKLVTRVSNDTEAINELFTTILVRLFKNVVMILGYAVVMISISPGMALVSFLLLPVVGVLTFVFRYTSRKAYQLTRNKITELNTFLSEHLSGMRLIQIFAREREKYQEFEQKSKELFAANWREVMIFAIFRPAIYLISVVAMIIVIGTGSSFVLQDTLSLGTLFIFITYISSFFQPIQELAEQFGTLQSSLASAEKVFSILDEKPDIVNAEHPLPVRIQGRIEFKHVWFAYEKEEYILKDVSFVIHPGEKVAFVGATGAGKTSILNLIGRYFDIQKGEILIDGVNIKDIDTDVLRGAIGQVQQDVFLFTGDIKTNISLGNPDISLEDVKAAARTVNAEPFIEKMPGGYDAPVTERGSTLSAGQRQLISFARTLAYKPSILVLDEATANIDTETESLITEALGKLMEGRTTIMVAHRLSTIQHADKIIVMHHGEIQESGNHQELLAQNGLYKKLYDLQLVES